jgi:hypothetical protein
MSIIPGLPLIVSILLENPLVPPKNRVSKLDLDLDLDVDVDGLIRGKLSRPIIYLTAIDLCMSASKSTSRSKSKSRTKGQGVSQQKPVSRISAPGTNANSYQTGAGF